MTAKFKVGDVVVVARVPTDEIFAQQHKQYSSAILHRRQFIIVQEPNPRSNMVLTDPHVCYGHFACLDALELAVAQPAIQQVEEIADKPFPKGMPESERRRIEAKLATRRFIRGY